MAGIWDIVAARFWEIDAQAERPAAAISTAIGGMNREARTIGGHQVALTRRNAGPPRFIDPNPSVCDHPNPQELGMNRENGVNSIY
jgi:hypothetical protein